MNPYIWSNFVSEHGFEFLAFLRASGVVGGDKRAVESVADPVGLGDETMEVLVTAMFLINAAAVDEFVCFPLIFFMKISHWSIDVHDITQIISSAP